MIYRWKFKQKTKKKQRSEWLN